MMIPFCPGLGLSVALLLPADPLVAPTPPSGSTLSTPGFPAELEFARRWVGSQGSTTAPAPAPATTGTEPPKEAPKSQPWRLKKALGLPDWLNISGSQRTRYESLDGQFRSTALGLNEDQQTLVLRTTLLTEATFAPFGAAMELIDSRQYLAEENDFLDTTVVDTFDFLQFNATFKQKSVFAAEDQGELLVGRYTQDFGSRRLVARNDFRNTINSFNGARASYDTASGTGVRAFWALPTNRLPTDFDGLLDDEPELDDMSTDTQFMGVFASREELFSAVRGELYYYYLDEQDSPDLQTTDRELSTTGFRLVTEKKPGEASFEAESAVQFGTSRSSRSASNTTDLDHFAYFQHLSAGYGFDANWKPRIEALFDYASGDSDPTDGDNGRFDTLYGARRWELGPTGILGILARSNLISPGWRLTGTPSERTEVMFANRFNWLASEKDAWTPAAIQDPTGSSGRYIGTFFEGRLRWHVVPKNISLEIGAAYMLAGTFIEEAPDSPGEDTAYAYVQAFFWF